MKEKRTIRGRLSFGSFMEIVSVIAIVNGVVPMVFAMGISSGRMNYVGIGVAVERGTSLGGGSMLLLYLGGVISVLVLGAISFPVYCLMARQRRLCHPTIITSEHKTEKSN